MVANVERERKGSRGEVAEIYRKSSTTIRQCHLNRFPLACISIQDSEDPLEEHVEFIYFRRNLEAKMPCNLEVTLPARTKPFGQRLACEPSLRFKFFGT